VIWWRLWRLGERKGQRAVSHQASLLKVLVLPPPASLAVHCALQKQSVDEAIEEERSKVDAKTPVTEEVG
jgi:hypothetical protein